MNKEKLMEKLRKLQDAYDKLFEAVLNSATDEDLQKLNNIEKMVEETKAQIEKLDDKTGKIPGSPVVLTESQKFVKRLIEAVSTNGNFAGALPREMADSVTELVNQYANLRQYCSVYTVGGEYAITVETGLPTATYVAEGSAIGNTDPKTTTVTLNAKKIGTISKLTNESITDVTFDLIGYVERSIARAFANQEDHEIIQGTGGVDAIEGVLSKDGIAKVTTAEAAKCTWEEVKATIGKLKAYRNGCILVMNQEVADMIQDFKDGSGNYIFPQNEELTSIKGHPVVISDQMPDLATGKAIMIAGNFSYYALADRSGYEMTLLSELYAANDMTGIKAVCRKDGKVGNKEAFAILMSV